MVCPSCSRVSAVSWSSSPLLQRLSTVLATVLALAAALSLLPGSHAQPIFSNTPAAAKTQNSAPFFGNDSTITTSSILVKFNQYHSTHGGGDVVAYEVSKRSIFNSRWDILPSNIGSQGSNISEVQIVTIKVNSLMPSRLSGTFRLGIERSQGIAEDFQLPSATPRIPYDATAAQFKAALQTIFSIAIRDVKRCDEITLPTDPKPTPIAAGGALPASSSITGTTITSSSGFAGWVNGCPYNTNGQGGYRWLVVFDIPAAAGGAGPGIVPKLIVLKNELTINSWTAMSAAQITATGLTKPSDVTTLAAQGLGPQIVVTRVTKGMYNPSSCVDGVCSVNATDLTSGTPYQFRTRVMTLEGWTDYSKTSDLRTPLEGRVPTRPRPPSVSAVSGTIANIIIDTNSQNGQTQNANSNTQNANILRNQRVLLIQSQYAVASVSVSGTVSVNGNWMQGGQVDLTQKTVNSDSRSESVVITLSGLDPSTTYVARIRYTNAYGQGVYSSASAPFTTNDDLALLSIPPAPQLAINTSSPVTPNSVSLLIAANPNHLLPAGSVSYKLQYHAQGERQWHTGPQTITFAAHKQGVEIQSILTRSSQGFCAGSFWLRLGVAESDNIGNAITPPIPFDATVEQMQQALLAIGSVNASNVGNRVSVRVHRVNNQYNGYTWTVEIQGLGAVTRLQLFKSTLYTYPLKRSANATLGDDTQDQTGECYPPNPAVPVVTATLKSGSDSFTSLTQTATIGGLQSNLLYTFRVQVMDPARRDYNGAVSSSVSVQTLPAVVPLAPGSVLTIGMDGIAQTDRDVNAAPSPRRDYGKIAGVPEMVPGFGYLSGKMQEQQYVQGAGLGGLSNSTGGHGVCVMITYNARKAQPTETFRYFYTGAAQRYTVAESTPVDGFVGIVTVKCWGGGGGGSKVTDLNRQLRPYALHRLSTGGGGAFAQVSVYTKAGDVIDVYVGQGGGAANGQQGGQGGFGGGGRGGDGLVSGGGGGGGASTVKQNGDIILVAAGGGGGGSTDYCCATGGAGGASRGQNGSYPGFNTPWPISNPADARLTPVTRRYQYTSSSCPDSSLGTFCLSEWDILAGSLPVEHTNIEWGAANTGNYTVWATAGAGGGPDSGGQAGASGSFQVRTTGELATLGYDSGGGAFSMAPVAVFSQGKGLEVQGQYGVQFLGGAGAEGQQGGGGGGGGYWGGGGGGSGLDGGGGGGGSSFVNLIVGTQISADLLTIATPVPYLTFLNESSVTFTWSLRWDGTVWGSASSFAIEMGTGADSEDFQPMGSVDTHQAYTSPMMEVASYTQMDLAPNTLYCFRVVPVFPKGRGIASPTLVAQTLALAVNYWESITPRRLSLAYSGRGFTNPVTNPASRNIITLPHLTPGAQIYSNFSSNNPLRFSDPDTETTKSLPSPRRGHSLTFVGDSVSVGGAASGKVKASVYMFGGRSDGYSCALSYKDTLDLGNPQSGLDVSPCTSLASEVSEVWTLDVYTYMWINYNVAGALPPGREQHSAALVPSDGNLYIFGGKSRLYPSLPSGKPSFTQHADLVFGDLYRLNLPSTRTLTLAWPYSGVSNGVRVGLSDSPLVIGQKGRVFVSVNGSVFNALEGTGINARVGDCIEKVTLTVTIQHACFNQLRISVMGPGPQSGSANFHAPATAHEVLLYNQRKTNGTGCISGTLTLTFDPDATALIDECCPQTYSGSYKPEGSLAEFVGAAASNQWTLVVQDMKPDDLSGSLISWSLAMRASPCYPALTWTNLTASSGGGPAARYGAKSVAYGRYLFVFGGRNSLDQPLQDLYRFDVVAATWKMLTAVNFYPAAGSFGTTLEPASSVGSSFLLTSWGVLRFGGYVRQPYISSGGGSANSDANPQYNADVYLLDPSSLRWRRVLVDAMPASTSTSTYSVATPRARYLAGAAFIPSGALKWVNSYSYRSLYDQPIPSSKANYAAANADSILVFGGHDGTSGSIYDGSSGGLFSDLWMLRLSNFSTPGERAAQAGYLQAQCGWRVGRVEPCLSKVAGTKCAFRDLLMLAWCSGANSTMA